MGPHVVQVQHDIAFSTKKALPNNVLSSHHRMAELGFSHHWFYSLPMLVSDEPDRVQMSLQAHVENDSSGIYTFRLFDNLASCPR